MLNKLILLPAQKLLTQVFRGLQKGRFYHLGIKGFQIPLLYAIHSGLKQPNSIGNFCNNRHKSVFQVSLLCGFAHNHGREIKFSNLFPLI